MHTYDKRKEIFFIGERQSSRPPRPINTAYKNDDAADFFRERWSSEIYSPVDFLRVTARTVTGEDGHFLEDEIDLHYASYSQYESFRPKETASKEQAKDVCVKKDQAVDQPIPKTPRKILNTVTGHVFDWHPLMHT